MLTGGILNGVGSLFWLARSPGGSMGLAFADGGSLATAWSGVASEGGPGNRGRIAHRPQHAAQPAPTEAAKGAAVVNRTEASRAGLIVPEAIENAIQDESGGSR